MLFHAMSGSRGYDHGRLWLRLWLLLMLWAGAKALRPPPELWRRNIANSRVEEGRGGGEGTSGGRGRVRNWGGNPSTS